MSRFQDPLEDILNRSGFANTMSKIVSVRGPLKLRYEGTWYKYLNILYTVWVEFVLVINHITVGSHFFRADVDVVDRCFSGFPFFSMSLVHFRTVYLYLRRERFAKLIMDYDRIYKGNIYLEEDVARYKKLNRVIPKILVVVTAAPMAPWCFMPIINSAMGGEWALTVPAEWFFDPYRDVQTFVTITILQSFAAGYTTLRIVLFDNIFYCYACRQLALTTHLRRELQRILSPFGIDRDGKPYYRDSRGKPTTKHVTSREVAEELRIWTINHQDSLRLASELQALYSPSLVFQYAMILMNLCTDALVVVSSHSDLVNVFFCFLYVIGNILELFVTCRIGDYITEESNKLEQATVGSHVHILDDYVYKSWFKMIMIRARIPIKLSALGVFPLNTGTFKDIIATTYSFFTLLKEMNS